MPTQLDKDALKRVKDFIIASWAGAEEAERLALLAQIDSPVELTRFDVAASTADPVAAKADVEALFVKIRDRVAAKKAAATAAQQAQGQPTVPAHHGHTGRNVAVLAIIALVAILAWALWPRDEAATNARASTAAGGKAPAKAPTVAELNRRLTVLEHPAEVAPVTRFSLPVTQEDVDRLLESDCRTEVRLARQLGWKTRGLPDKPEAEAVAACVARAKATATPTAAATPTPSGS